MVTTPALATSAFVTQSAEPGCTVPILRHILPFWHVLFFGTQTCFSYLHKVYTKGACSLSNCLSFGINPPLEVVRFSYYFHIFFSMVLLAQPMQIPRIITTTQIIPSNNVANHPFRDHPFNPWRILLSQLSSAASLITLLSSATFLILSNCSCRLSVMFGMWIQQCSLSNLRYPHTPSSLTNTQSKASLFCKVILVLAWTCLLIIWNPF